MIVYAITASLLSAGHYFILLSWCWPNSRWTWVIWPHNVSLFNCDFVC